MTDTDTTVDDARWAAMRVRFIAQLDPAEQDRIRRVSQEAVDVAEPWLRAFPSKYYQASWPIAVIMASLDPGLTSEAFDPVLRFLCWTFIFDDAFDEDELTPGQAKAKMAEYLGVLDGSVRSADPVVTALGELRADLTALPLFAGLENEWVGALRTTMHAMLKERDWQEAVRLDAGALPSYTEYLGNAMYTVDSESATWTALSAMTDRSIVTELDHLRTLNRTLARCIRLANDRQTYVKEARTGGINAVGVHQAHSGDLSTAVALITKDVDEFVRRLTASASTPRTNTGRAERWIAGCAQLADQFYARHEFRTFHDSES